MAPLLSTTATCVCCNTPLEGKSLRDVAVHGLRKAENPPSYTVKLTKSKLSFKPASKGVKKLKPIELREVDDTYVIEESDVVAFSFKNGKVPTCLALKFGDTNARKEFQTLSKTSISNAKKSKKDKKKEKKEESKKSQKGKVSEERKPESNSEPPHKRPSKSSLTLSDVEAPQQSRRTSSPRKFHDEGSGSALSPPVKAESSVCSHCHQKLPNRILASRIEYDPQNYMPSRSPRPRARSYDFSLGGSNGSVCYIGPRSSIKKSYQPSFTGRNRVPYHRTHSRASPSDTRTDEGDGSSFTSTTPSFKNGHFIRIGTITCRTPKPQRRSSQFKKTAFEPTSKRQDLKRSKSQSIVYYIWDSSGDEEDESDDYESNPTSTDESVSSYDSAPSFASTRSKKIEKLLHELGKPGAIRLY